jgi:3-hydroxyisobutyrate dehydrogenase
MSTIGPDETRQLAARVPQGVSFVDAPVGGSVGAAGSGQLRIFAGGDDAALAHAGPVLGKLGTVRRCGGVGEGSALKLVVNTGLITALAALHDALLVAEAVGVERAVALEVLEAGPLAGAVKRASVTDSEFTTALAAKDARLALREAPGATVLSAAERLLDAEPEPQRDITQLVRKGQQ